MCSAGDSPKLCQCSEEVPRLQAKLQAAKTIIGELKASQESQTYELDDVNVIINLQDDLRASKEVIQQQKSVMENLAREKAENKIEKDENESQNSYKSKFLELQARYSKLENERAWAEFQFRDRICNDSLKYHRRLIHWKSQNQKLESELREAETRNEKEIQELQTKWKSTASSVLQHTLQDLKTSQKNCKQLEKEIARLKLQETENEIMSTSSKFLLKAATQSTFLK